MSVVTAPSAPLTAAERAWLEVLLKNLKGTRKSLDRQIAEVEKRLDESNT